MDDFRQRARRERNRVKGTEDRSDQRCLVPGTQGRGGGRSHRNHSERGPGVRDRELRKAPPHCVTLDYRPLDVGEPAHTLWVAKSTWSPLPRDMAGGTPRMLPALASPSGRTFLSARGWRFYSLKKRQRLNWGCNWSTERILS